MSEYVLGPHEASLVTNNYTLLYGIFYESY